MRLLHTADWHVGKGLQGRSRLDEQEAVLAEIAGIARDRDVELILVSGDLFDSASPTPEAERIVYKALLDLAACGRVVVVPGNHDSERRLQAVQALFDLARVTIRPFVDPDPIVFDSNTGEPVVLATLPWISQRYIVKATQLMELDGFDMNALFRDRLKGIIDKICEPFRADTINLIAGHVTIAGGLMGGGERTAQTIFEYWIDATAFPSNAHYVGLGHLHKTQKMPGPCPIHYSGAPLHLDFSDDEGDNHVLIVEARPGAPATVEEVALASGRRLRTLRGTMKQLEALVGTTGEDHLRVIVEGKAHTGLGDEIRGLFPSAVKVIVEPKDRDAGAVEPPSREGLSPAELFARFLGEKDIEDPALLKLFSELYEECA